MQLVILPGINIFLDGFPYWPSLAVATNEPRITKAKANPLDALAFSVCFWKGNGITSVSHISPIQPRCQIYHWIGLRENLQETMVFTIKYRAFL